MVGFTVEQNKLWQICNRFDVQIIADKRKTIVVSAVIDNYPFQQGYVCVGGYGQYGGKDENLAIWNLSFPPNQMLMVSST